MLRELKNKNKYCTCDASSDTHKEEAISGDFAKDANVCINKPFKLGGTAQLTKPNNEATGSQPWFSQNATRTFSF